MSAAASEVLLARKEALAGEAARTFLDARNGAAVEIHEDERERRMQEVRDAVEHLAPAVGLEDPALFTAYVRSLDGPEAVSVVGHLGEALEAHIPGPYREPVRSCFRSAFLQATGVSSK